MSTWRVLKTPMATVFMTPLQLPVVPTIMTKHLLSVPSHMNLAKRQAGFSLVEMAVVVVILGLVLGALLLPLQAQRNQVFQSQTETTLETARRALLGFAKVNGRLPCPSTERGRVGKE